MTETRKLRVFLCHSSQDKPIVRELYHRLNAEGWIDPWLDERNFSLAGLGYENKESRGFCFSWLSKDVSLKYLQVATDMEA